ncbi:MAG TPA: DUF3460 family protein [Burkholderiales bacterium]|nr:DUF3460 family protein [Burkholderiales bacterium]
MKPYESDVTRFLRELIRKRPELVAEQERARATWWDRPQDARLRKELEAAEVPKKAYEYY